jgi:uncharacterized protein
MASDVIRQLNNCAHRGDVAGVSAALLAGASVNAQEGTPNWTPLQCAAERGNVSVVDALLAAGAHLEGTDSRGRTALLWAADAGSAGVSIATLLAAGADVHHADREGDTALHRTLHRHVARVLLEAGARTDVRNLSGRQPIDEVRGAAGLIACSCACVRARARMCLWRSVHCHTVWSS